MPMIDCVVETVEALAVHIVHVVAHRALQEDLHDVFAANQK